MTIETVYTIINLGDDGVTPTINELKTKFEKGSDEVKISCMKQLISMVLSGESCDQLLMHIIRFVLPSKNKQLKKLLHFYWEACPKYNPDGKLKQEMILVCNAIRNDLQHPNEFIRGATLRFLAKLRDPELLEPLVPSCRLCLEHRLSYVRKNAVLAISTIFRHNPGLIPDAPELIQTFLAAENDSTCKRNAFLMLARSSPSKATEYFLQISDQLSSQDELLQLAIIEHIRKEASQPSSEKGKYIKAILELLSASSPSVKYEAATSIAALTSNSTALKAAGSTFLDLAQKEADNNVKMIALDRFASLGEKNPGLLTEMIMEVLRVLSSSPDIDVRHKVLNIAQKLINKRNVDYVIHFLQKELAKTHDQEYEKNSEYRELLITSTHTCAIRFPEAASKVVTALMEFVGESNTNAAVDVISFVKEVCEKFENLRPVIMTSLLNGFGEIKASRALRGALWVIGEYSTTIEIMDLAFEKIRSSIGDVPILASEQMLLDKSPDNPTELPTTSSSSRRVNADGTYATESSLGTSHPNLDATKHSVRPPLRHLLIRGDYFLASSLATALTKLVLRYQDLSSDASEANSLRAEAMLILTGVIRLGQSQFCSAPIDDDNYDRIMGNLKVLGHQSLDAQLRAVFQQDGRAAYSKLIGNQAQAQTKEPTSDSTKASSVEVDDLVDFPLLESKSSKSVEDEYARDLILATGELAAATDGIFTKLDRIVGLSGFSDVIYCEAIVEVYQRDIRLEILLVNQTSETLQNVTLEFATLGDLRLVEKPAACTLAPNAFHSTRALIKVSSTETGVIFGNLSCDRPGAPGTVIVLNDLHVDIMDYIHPATCTLRSFRKMWSVFEWENKVSVNTKISNLGEFLNVILKSTNMATLTPIGDLTIDDCNFLSVNLYARTLFGEDALANLSIEKLQDGSIAGHVRIRSKAQGLALSLGDKISQAQKV